MKKTGLYFGSFNPIHVGHLIIAEYLLEHSDLQELWFVVSPQNPLKKKASLLDDRQRLHLVNLAIGDDLRFRACDIEFSLPKPSYTSYTLQVLHEQYPQREFCRLSPSRLRRRRLPHTPARAPRRCAPDGPLLHPHTRQPQKRQVRTLHDARKSVPIR